MKTIQDTNLFHIPVKDLWFVIELYNMFQELFFILLEMGMSMKIVHRIGNAMDNATGQSMEWVVDESKYMINVISSTLPQLNRKTDHDASGKSEVRNSQEIRPQFKCFREL